MCGRPAPLPLAAGGMLCFTVLCFGCAVDVDLARPGFPCNSDGRCGAGLVCVEGRCVEGGAGDGGRAFDGGQRDGGIPHDGGGWPDGGDSDGGRLDASGGDGGPWDGGTDGGSDGGGADGGRDGGVADAGAPDGGQSSDLQVTATPASALIWDTVQLQVELSGALSGADAGAIQWEALGPLEGRFDPLVAGSTTASGPDTLYYPLEPGTHRIQVTVTKDDVTRMAEVEIAVAGFETVPLPLALDADYQKVASLAVDPATGWVGAATRAGPLLLAYDPATGAAQVETCDAVPDPPRATALGLYDAQAQRFLLGFERDRGYLVAVQPGLGGDGQCSAALVQLEDSTTLKKPTQATGAAQAADGSVWVTTDRGLWHLAPGELQSWEHYTFDALGESLGAVGIDASGQLFVSGRLDGWVRTGLPVDPAAPVSQVNFGGAYDRVQVIVPGLVDPLARLSEIWLPSGEPAGAILRLLDTTAPMPFESLYSLTIDGKAFSGIDGAAYDPVSTDLFFADDDYLFRYKRDFDAIVLMAPRGLRPCNDPIALAVDVDDPSRGRRLWVGCRQGFAVAIAP